MPPVSKTGGCPECAAVMSELEKLRRINARWVEKKAALRKAGLVFLFIACMVSLIAWGGAYAYESIAAPYDTAAIITMVTFGLAAVLFAVGLWVEMFEDWP